MRWDVKECTTFLWHILMPSATTAWMNPSACPATQRYTQEEKSGMMRGQKAGWVAIGSSHFLGFCLAGWSEFNCIFGTEALRYCEKLPLLS